MRAFQTEIYRQAKVSLAQETIRLNQKVAEEVRKLAEQGKLRGADLILAQTEVDAARAQLPLAQSALIAARTELLRSLGITGSMVNVQGTLEKPIVPADPRAVVQEALEQRADLRARQLGVVEAEGRVRLQKADRFGNPLIGPFYESDMDRINFYGIQWSVPLPVFNLRHGEIEQRGAEIGAASWILAAPRCWSNRMSKPPWPGSKPCAPGSKPTIRRCCEPPIEPGQHAKALLAGRARSRCPAHY